MAISSPWTGAIMGATFCLFLVMAFFQNTTPEKEYKKSTYLTDLESEDDLSKVITTNSVVMIDFYADWCGPCKQLKPILHEIAEEYHEDVRVITVNVDSFKNLAGEYSVSGIPDIRVYKNGKEEVKLSGVQPKHVYIDAIEELIEIKD